MTPRIIRVTHTSATVAARRAHQGDVVAVETPHPHAHVELQEPLWPDGASRDYAAVHAERHVENIGGVPAETRVYDPYSAYPLDEPLPTGQPYGRAINNLLWKPSSHAIETMASDLAALAPSWPVLYWDSAIQCFPEVACQLRRLFRLTILGFGDDLPGSSNLKTFPVARWFDVLFHNMHIYDRATGRTVPQVYAARGLSDCRFVAWGPMEPVYDEAYFDRKIQAMQDGVLDFDLAWVGSAGLTPARHRLIRAVEALGAPRWALFGPEMAAGLWPELPSSLYARSLFGLNAPEGSFFNGRFADLMCSGTIMLAHDPWGELSHFGFVDGEHFIGFDGTAAGLAATVEARRGDRCGLARIARAGRTRFLDYRAEFDMDRVLGKVLRDYARQIENGRQ